MSAHAEFPPQSADHTAVGPPGGAAGIVMHLQHTWHQPNIYDYKTLKTIAPFVCADPRCAA